ncbi:pyrroline-5-carboxylate reductase [Chelatococcus sp. SYSU_G07232]|uniref:Pyrroline-5-carboxylate reductase n=1 Tax=Chelatococcus albus TaxID=3047466 RepID=A0ABT7AIT0_9HYPH|nr:pyrroline-5-carboxylate reductase [Chelatococcus sp. SYSU_G07232]MDJ1159288.1 pyrroline-5-carboxylate reductase [Chelatococcus sp. SYSU_G07232]
MVAALPSTLVLVGAGKMGSAMLDGWLATGMAGPGITILDPHPSADIAALADRTGIRLNPPHAEISPPEALVLAIKPQSLDAAAPEIARLAGAGTVVVSILAGKTIANLKARLPQARAVVRAMPNLPASVRRGVTAAVASRETSQAERAMADALLSGVGTVEWLSSEHLIDAVTAVSGSGPAYVFYLTECLAKAGAAAGLPEDLAIRLARATVTGAGELLHQSDLPAAKLRQNVTSPGGTTAAALDVLMNNALEPLMVKAVAAARKRAQELSG